MTKEQFDQLIEENIKVLNKSQILHFSWLCAVRALPFLGSKDPFWYWKKQDRQKHLFSVLNAIDNIYFPNHQSAYAAYAAYAAAYAATAPRTAYVADAALTPLTPSMPMPMPPPPPPPVPPAPLAPPLTLWEPSLLMLFMKHY